MGVRDGGSGLKILMLTGSMDALAGGPPRVIAGSAVALARRGHRVDVVGLCDPDITAKMVFSSFPDLREDGISLELFPRTGPRILGRSRAMSAALQTRILNYDAVHVHGIWEQSLAESCAMARRAGVATFVSAHGMLDSWSMNQSWLKKQLALRFLGTGAMLVGANAIVYGTEDEMQESQPSAPGSVGVVVPNGIETAALTTAALPTATLLDQRFPALADWRRTILYFSRIHPKKGLDLLVDSFIELAPSYSGTGLLIAGIAQDKAYEAEIRARIAGSTVADRVVMTTDLTGQEARVVFRRADIFALPSHQEGLSIAILEAMSLGKALLISDRCHLPEVAGAWGCGLVAGDNREAISASLQHLLRLPHSEIREMGARGRRAILANFSWDVIVRRLETLYAVRDSCVR